jgi:hypothetical protein
LNTFSREVCEHALAHKLPDKVEAAYRRGDLPDKRSKLIPVPARVNSVVYPVLDFLLDPGAGDSY